MPSSAYSGLMVPDIIRKLSDEIDRGITTEAQVVYLLAGIRKMLEQQQAPDYKYLRFHCDWALHSRLRGKIAQEILGKFDAANIHLKAGMELTDLPNGLGKEIDQISKMESFREEFYQFLEIQGFPKLGKNNSDGWTRFLHLYARVIEDCPLEIRLDDRRAGIEKVTVNMQLADKLSGDQMYFRVRWIISDRNGKSGKIFVINSFTVS